MDEGLSFCLFCNKSNKSNEFPNPIRPERNKRVFNLICCKIGIVNSEFDWDFDREPLPFCQGCNYHVDELDNACNASDSDEEFAIFATVERIKFQIRNSATEISAIDEFITYRYREFRNQVLERIKADDGRLDPTAIVSRIDNNNGDCPQGGTLFSNLEENQGRQIPDSDNVEVFLSFGNGSSEAEVDDPEETPKWRNSNSYGSEPHGFVEVIKPRDGSNAWKCGAEGCIFVVSTKKKSPPKKIIEYHIRSKHFENHKCLAQKCPKRFRTLEQRDQHMATGHEPSSQTLTPLQVYRCSKCDKGYQKVACLNKHELRHIQDDESIDEIIETSEQNPDSSTKTSESPKNYRCQFCYKPFPRKSNALRHEETHCEGGPKSKSPCHVCGKQFLRDGLNEHLRLVHNQGSSPVKMRRCSWENCTQSFPNDCRLERHVQSVHKKSEVEK